MSDHLRVQEMRPIQSRHMVKSISSVTPTLSTSISRWTFIDRAVLSMLPFLMSLMATSSPHLRYDVPVLA